jgi:hypothetical protein
VDGHVTRFWPDVEDLLLISPDFKKLKCCIDPFQPSSPRGKPAAPLTRHPSECLARFGRSPQTPGLDSCLLRLVEISYFSCRLSLQIHYHLTMASEITSWLGSAAFKSQLEGPCDIQRTNDFPSNRTTASIEPTFT